MCWGLLVCLLPGTALAVKYSSPVRIGVLTASWGPPPHVMGLIEGLGAMGYRENEDFVIGVRFTQGDSTVLPAVARACRVTEVGNSGQRFQPKEHQVLVLG